VPGDTTRADTTVRDTLERFLPVFAPAIARGPLPRGERRSFDADSLVLSNITTLGDLLGHLPGVYVARGGWFGAPEIAVYGGKGPMGLELYWDGMPYLPLGRDSVWVDPARIPLAPLERVDIQVLPSTLRVFLVTARARSSVPRTGVQISTGVNSIAQYRAVFGKRWLSGIGLSLAADYRNIDGMAGSSTTAFNMVDLWLRGELVKPRFGLSYQIVSSAWIARRKIRSSRRGSSGGWTGSSRGFSRRATTVSGPGSPSGPRAPRFPMIRWCRIATYGKAAWS